MTNLATLIGVTNLQTLVSDLRNTHVVIKDGEGFNAVKNTNEVDVSFVIGIGSYHQCNSLAKYLSLQALAIK
jgi:hypothetical protein